MSSFTYSPSHHVPFRDAEVLERCRRITRADFANHPNKSLDVRVVPDEEAGFLFLMDVFYRIYEHTHLPVETLFLRYTDALLKLQQNGKP